MTRPKQESISSKDWEQRHLCPDGSCLGVLGPDGICRICGRRGEAAAASTSDSDSTYEEETTSEKYEYEDQNGSADDPFGPDRKLCPDGGCIGILDSKGRCKICGRSF